MLSQDIDDVWLWLSKGEVDYRNFDSEREFKQKVKNILFEKIAKLVVASGQSKPPFDPSRIGTLRRVNEIKYVPLEKDGVLMAVQDGFLIKINENLSDVRKRFTCAHEIAHTFFFDLDASPPKYRYNRFRSRHQVEEGLCHEMAREMLMPRFAIKRLVSLRYPEPSIRAFTSLAKIFRVSLQALAFRIGDLNLWHAIIASFSIRQPTNAVSFELLNFPIKAGKFQHAPRIYRHKRTIESDSPLGKMLTRAYSAGYAAGTCRDFGEIKGNLWVEAKHIPGNYPRIWTIWSRKSRTFQTKLSNKDPALTI